MKKATNVLVGLLALYVVAIFVPFDPDAGRPGTRLGGSLAKAQDTDWSFLNDKNEIYVETQTWYLIPHSVTTNSIVVDGAFYVPCGRCKTKRWPKNVQRDPRVRIKIDDKLYERTAVLITDAAQRRALLYKLTGGSAADGVEIYRMGPLAE